MDFIFVNGLPERINGGFIQAAMNDTVVSFLTHAVIPHVTIFALLIAVGEMAAGLSFLFRLFTCLGGIIAMLHSIVNLLVLWNTGPETFGQNYLLIIVALALVIARAGRTWGLDGILIRNSKIRLFKILG